MRCIGCGEFIDGEPIWVGGEPYCSQECAEDVNFEEEEYEGRYEDHFEEELY